MLIIKGSYAGRNITLSFFTSSLKISHLYRIIFLLSMYAVSFFLIFLFPNPTLLFLVSQTFCTKPLTPLSSYFLLVPFFYSFLHDLFRCSSLRCFYLFYYLSLLLNLNYISFLFTPITSQNITYPLPFFLQSFFFLLADLNCYIVCRKIHLLIKFFFSSLIFSIFYTLLSHSTPTVSYFSFLFMKI